MGQGVCINFESRTKICDSGVSTRCNMDFSLSQKIKCQSFCTNLFMVDLETSSYHLYNKNCHGVIFDGICHHKGMRKEAIDAVSLLDPKQGSSLVPFLMSLIYNSQGSNLLLLLKLTLYH